MLYIVVFFQSTILKNPIKKTISYPSNEITPLQNKNQNSGPSIFGFGNCRVKFKSYTVSTKNGWLLSKTDGWLSRAKLVAHLLAPAVILGSNPSLIKF